LDVEYIPLCTVIASLNSFKGPSANVNGVVSGNSLPLPLPSDRWSVLKLHEFSYFDRTLFVVRFPDMVVLEKQPLKTGNCGFVAIANAFSTVPILNINMAYLMEKLESEKKGSFSNYLDESGIMYIRFVSVALRRFIQRQVFSVTYLNLPFLVKNEFPTWEDVILSTPASAHLLIILGKCDKSAKLNHFIAVNLVTNVFFDGTANGVAFDLNVRTLTLSVLKVPIAAVAITFCDDNFIVENMIKPNSNSNCSN
jgi:hypothetical protein